MTFILLIIAIASLITLYLHGLHMAALLDLTESQLKLTQLLLDSATIPAGHLRRY